MLNKIILAAALAFTSSVAVAAPVDYVVSPNGQFGTLDLQTGAYNQISNTGIHFEDITRLPGGMLYGTDNSSRLFTINTSTGATATVGNDGIGLGGIKFRQDGTLFGFSLSGLYTINPATAAATPVGPFGQTFSIADLAFGSNGMMLLEGDSSLYTVNPATGALTLVGPTTGYSIASTEFEGGILYGFPTNPANPIVSINPNTGSGTPLVTQSNALGEIYGAAPTSVPEPSLIAMIAVGFMATLGRQRRLMTRG